MLQCCGAICVMQTCSTRALSLADTYQGDAPLDRTSLAGTGTAETADADKSVNESRRVLRNGPQVR
jgi:hypothetical protein